MKKHSALAAVAALAMGLSPLSAFAATADVSTDQVMEAIDESASMDRGGGGMADSMYYPGPYGGGITVDATVTKEVTPDYVAVNGYCEVSNLGSRDDVRAALTKIYEQVKQAVGSDGRVRRGGSPSVYPYYDAYGTVDSGKMSGSLNVFVRVTKASAAARIADVLEANGCSAGWDVRMVDAEDYESALLDQLVSKVNKRKALYEKLIGKKLKDVAGVSLSTWIDGWSTYDPETNKADAVTTLSITFDVGAGSRLPAIETRATPKG